MNEINDLSQESLAQIKHFFDNLKKLVSKKNVTIMDERENRYSFKH